MYYTNSYKRKEQIFLLIHGAFNSRKPKISPLLSAYKTRLKPNKNMKIIYLKISHVLSTLLLL